MTTKTTRRPRRYLVLGVEGRGGRKVVRCLNRYTDETFCIYRRGRRWVFFATDAPVRDQTLRKHAQFALDAHEESNG